MTSLAPHLAACLACGAANRVPHDKPASAAVCGRCGQSLSLDKPVDVTDEQFTLALEKSSGLVLVDVWAPWCGPCRAMAPQFAAAAHRLAGRARLIKLNADSSQIVRSLGVSGIPALLLFRDGRMIDRKAGLMNSDMIAAWVSEYSAASAKLAT